MAADTPRKRHDVGSLVSQADFKGVYDHLRDDLAKECSLREMRTEAGPLLTKIGSATWSDREALTLGAEGSDANVKALDRWALSTFKRGVSHANKAFAFTCKRLNYDLTFRFEWHRASGVYRLVWRYFRHTGTNRRGAGALPTPDPPTSAPPAMAINAFQERVAVAEPTPRTSALGGPSPRRLADGVTWQERKNVLEDHSLSVRILEASAKTMPSFAACVKGSVVFPPIGPRHKDVPFVPGTKYNHFIHVAALIRVAGQHDAEQYVAAYYRIPRKGISQYERTRGWSILWGTSLACRMPPDANQSPPTEQWLERLAEDPEAATRTLTACHGSLVSTLLNYKYGIDLEGSREIGPFAVITRDERTKKHGALVKRVYTDYVFTSLITLDHWNRIRPNLQIAVDLKRVERQRVAQLENWLFDKETGRLNVMDVLAYRGIFTKKSVIKDKQYRASFTKGFQLI